MILLIMPDGESLRRSEVVNWYLKELESEIETEEELAHQKFIVDKVLDRLIHHVITLFNENILSFDVFL